MEKNEDSGELKGMIDFPCGCKAKALIYKDSKGRFSVRCPVCGKYTRFDSDTMSAETIGAVRGATRKLKIRGLSPRRLGP
ncbi:MAG: hypothetical protein J5949_03095 [Oscillospiraceae bacterium]|nr:hypothetical protein [Oscillospiraceae bacterium]